MEQAQVAQLNEQLAATGTLLTADRLGVRTAAGGPLVEVVYEGSPIFGYVWGHFRVSPAPGGDAVRVLLHTDHLRAISRALGLPNHHWGM
jgi:hypothetical protein